MPPQCSSSYRGLPRQHREAPATTGVVGHWILEEDAAANDSRRRPSLACSYTSNNNMTPRGVHPEAQVARWVHDEDIADCDSRRRPSIGSYASNSNRAPRGAPIEAQTARAGRERFGLDQMIQRQRAAHAKYGPRRATFCGATPTTAEVEKSGSGMNIFAKFISGGLGWQESSSASQQRNNFGPSSRNTPPRPAQPWPGFGLLDSSRGRRTQPPTLTHPAEVSHEQDRHVKTSVPSILKPALKRGDPLEDLSVVKDALGHIENCEGGVCVMPASARRRYDATAVLPIAVTETTAGALERHRSQTKGDDLLCDWQGRSGAEGDEGTASVGGGTLICGWGEKEGTEQKPRQVRAGRRTCPPSDPLPPINQPVQDAPDQFDAVLLNYEINTQTGRSHKDRRVSDLTFDGLEFIDFHGDFDENELGE